jgi:hypothetical protein
MEAAPWQRNRVVRRPAGARRHISAALALLLVLAACSSSDSSGTAATIVVRTDVVQRPFDRRLLGTNVPAWLLPELVADQTFRDLTIASGTTLLRLPGGSWSNDYDWLACETGDADGCLATWGMRPSDFISLLEATGLPAMWTVSFNGTAQEAAAAVAFFNGDVDDERVLGTDRNGRDWLTVGHWARLRAEGGHPAPVDVRYWEVGNEVFGAVADAGPDCASWGWENVWTCDGTEYVEGNGDHDGFRRFREVMREVDPSIDVGAVGVGDRGAWSGWDDEVMAAAGPDLDFYVVHHYGSNGDVAADDVMDIPSDAWPRISADVREGFDDHGIGDVPIAVTEHNLVAFVDGDDERLMTTALNAFYLAETIGRMAENGVSIANQWNLANGRAENGSDYGLLDAQTHERSPAYYALALWSRFGDELVAVDVGDDLDDLVVFAGRGADGAARLLVINPSDRAVGATVAAEPAPAGGTVTADSLVAESPLSTSVTFNGATSPSRGLTEPGQSLPVVGSELRYDFPASSITLLRWSAQS